MTRAEAKRYVCRCMAVTLEADLSNGSGWIFAANGVDEGERPRGDLKRIVSACHDLIDELHRRGAPRAEEGDKP